MTNQKINDGQARLDGAGFMIRPMVVADYEAALALWQMTEGMGLSSADEKPAIARYLMRNPGMSMVALDATGALVGSVLCGHDGRRGYLHHLAVRSDCRGLGLGRALVQAALEALHAEEIDKCHLFVYTTNQAGRAFWQQTGWSERQTLVIMSKDI